MFSLLVLALFVYNMYVHSVNVACQNRKYTFMYEIGVFRSNTIFSNCSPM